MVYTKVILINKYINVNCTVKLLYLNKGKIVNTILNTIQNTTINDSNDIEIIWEYMVNGYILIYSMNLCIYKTWVFILYYYFIIIIIINNESVVISRLNAHFYKQYNE